ncbi:hypothetical protein [Spirosoma gilvum]
MKTSTKKTVWAFYALCLVFFAYACRNQDAAPLTPKYTMESLRDLQLPGLRQSTPAPVTVTPSTMTPSAPAAQVKSDLGSNPSSQAVTDAANAMNQALSTAGISPSTLIASFTPSVISTLNAGGKLPDLLQARINSLVGNAALQPYLLTFTYPTVNGIEITPTTLSIPGPGTVTIPTPLLVTAINYGGSDPCFKQANDLYDTKIFGLDNDRQSQAATVNASYNQAKSSAESDVQGCVSGKLAQYQSLISTAYSNLGTDLAHLDAASATLGGTKYDLLKAFLYTLYAQQIQSYYQLQPAELNTCAITSIAKIAAAQFARDTDLAAIITNFNETIRTAYRIVLSLYDSCHNQGTVAP